MGLREEPLLIPPLRRPADCICQRELREEDERQQAALMDAAPKLRYLAEEQRP